MAKRKPKARPNSKPALTPEIKEAYIKLVEGTFFDIMMALVRAEPNEEGYGKFGEAARKLTTEQHHLIARYAGEHFVNGADPNFGKLSKEEVRHLQETSIQHALDRLANEDGN